MKKNLQETYNPLYFLSALGSGGLAISFFMYLQFMIPHKGSPMATYNHVQNFMEQSSTFTNIFIIASYIGFAIFTLVHFRLLSWNISEYLQFNKTLAFQKLKDSPQTISLMSIPLTLAMTVNVLMIAASLFIPNLWDYIEYLFPVSLTAFTVIGIYALKIFLKYMTKVIIEGDKDFVNTNNLSNMLSIFTFSMIAVGFAAPAAMSHLLTVNTIGMILSIFFLGLSGVLAFVKFTLGFKNIVEKGISMEGSPSLWIVIPFLTLVGITIIRLLMSVDHHFEGSVSNPTLLIIAAFILGMQIFNGMIGYFVMKKNNYFKHYLEGDKKSAASFSLICPGVAFFVFGMFFIHFGLVRNNVVEMFSPYYYAIIIPFLLIQVKTITTFFKLNYRLIFKKEEVKESVMA
ncbi:MAG: hypothetical protein ACEPOV_07740 [Hyphomicrobiales bacterium]